MISLEALVALALLLFQPRISFSFVPHPKWIVKIVKPRIDFRGKPVFAVPCDDGSLDVTARTRRAFLFGFGTAMALGGASKDASAAVGTLPEFQDTNAILQGLTINVVDQSQLKSFVQFLTQGFGLEILRQRIQGPVEEIVSFNIAGEECRQLCHSIFFLR
jgi:hypothetical protein